MITNTDEDKVNVRNDTDIIVGKMVEEIEMIKIVQKNDSEELKSILINIKDLLNNVDIYNTPSSQ